ncbi:MAG: glutamate-5-semialdehyde dehydrogenase [Candidatus Verstraetearchaeota archaeon]|nr:glutamate-5-semialdehyde dehydrogenase [Candidatus Verstraetearchaeota archaeon]
MSVGSGLELKLVEAKNASLALGNAPSELKNQALKIASDAILERKEEILSSNRVDLEFAKVLLERREINKSLFDRLKLDEAKVEEIAKMVSSVADLEDPVGRVLYSIKMDEGLELFKVSVPFGVIVSIFESRPDALPQIAALCIKSGNSVVLKGGAEARASNRKIFEIMKDSFTKAGLPEGCMQLVEEREAVGALLKMEGYVDLIIPRGSNEFVKYIQENTRIPVLGHSSGICHVYVDSKADLSKAIKICLDARIQYPAACNSMKILLVDRGIAEAFLPAVSRFLIEEGVRIKGCPETKELLSRFGVAVDEADESDWTTEYLDLTLPVKIVSDIEEAISHINRYGSKHTDAIITEDLANARKFITSIDSSSVFHNASTRFSDGYRYGLGAEVGISTNKIHARGPVGLEGLVTTKWILLGSGQVVSDYVGKKAKPFLHRKTDPDWEERLK